jgi:hypothetical protein
VKMRPVVPAAGFDEHPNDDSKEPREFLHKYTSHFALALSGYSGRPVSHQRPSGATRCSAA